MRLRIYGFLSCKRDSGLDGCWTVCSTSKSSERERLGVWTSAVMQGALAWWASHALPYLSHTWLSYSTHAQLSWDMTDRHYLFQSVHHVHPPKKPPTLKPCIYTLHWFSQWSFCCLNILIYILLHFVNSIFCQMLVFGACRKTRKKVVALIRTLTRTFALSN